MISKVQIILKNKYSNNFIWNAIGSTFNSFNSLFLLIVITRINGLSDAGIFSYAFAMSVIFYVIAVYAGRTFQVTESNKSISDKDYIIHRAITCSIMLIVSLIFVIVNKYNIYKSTIFMLVCLFRCIEAFSDVFHGILQKNNKLNIVRKIIIYKSYNWTYNVFDNKHYNSKSNTVVSIHMHC